MKKMSNKTYDVLKWIAMIGLPALITFYGIVGATCHIPYTDAVLTIAGAFDAMMGTMLGISSKALIPGVDATLALPMIILSVQQG